MKRIDGLGGQVQYYYLFDYHPWRGGQNPKFDATSGLLLDFKNEKHTNHATAVLTFANLLSEQLKGVIDAKQVYYLAIVPSHEKSKISQGLLDIASVLCKNLPITFSGNPLVRTKTIKKLTEGGSRDRQTHLDSISPTSHLRKNANYILLDDVVTTGNSIEVCKEILQNEGGKSFVISVALGHTF